MKTRIVVVVTVIAALLVLAAGTGCQRPRSADQISQDVRSRINGDQAVQSRQYTVAAQDGVVTLSGYVNSDQERAAAAADAAQVDGVKTVVNNLEVEAPNTPQETQAQATPPATPSYEPPAEERHHTGRNKPSSIGRTSHNAEPSSPAPEYRAQNTPVDNVQPAVPRTPPPPPKPVEVTIPQGTTFSVRLVDSVDSEKNQAGDAFRGTLDSPVTINDAIVIPAGADVSGRVTNAKSAAHFAGRSELALELMEIRVNGKSYELHTDQYARQGTARGKNTAAKVGGGAALGALIGGLAGGGKGAAIGAAVGAGAGTGVQAATHGQNIHLGSEQVLAFHLESSIRVTPAPERERNPRQKLEYNE
jgi:hypothetical protein